MKRKFNLFSDLSKYICIGMLVPLLLAAEIPNTLEKHYNSGNYWQAAQSALALLNKADQQDAAAIYIILGNSLLKMHLHQGAEQAFRYIVEHFIDSPQIPFALQGLQTVEYAQNHLEKSLQYYDILQRGNLQQPLKSIAGYYAGMVHYKQNNYPRAIKNMLLVHDKNENYVYAQYTIALSLMRMRHLKEGLERLEQLCVHSPKNKDERYVVNEARLSCGYANYEMERYETALLFFQTVNVNSEHHQDALLAAGWAAVKIPDYEQAIHILGQLVEQYTDPTYIQEALFLLGHAHLRQQHYDKAIEIYAQLIATFNSEFSDPLIIEEENQRLELERKRVENRQLELYALEMRAANILAFSQTDDSPEQKKLEKERTELFNHIRKERQELQALSLHLDKVTASAAIRQERRNWQVYAEFGKMRAQFLKRQAEAQN